MHNFYFQSMYPSSSFVPDGYFFFCSAGKVFAAPYSKTYDTTTQNWHYTRIGNYEETGDICTF
ncbi:hypothetical protein PDN73_31550 [Bacillus cereus]|nr:hypothetical protein [Bacillus cereus]